MIGSRTLHLLALLTLAAAPAAAQTEERLGIALGDAVQVKVVGDTAWKEADIVEVGSCRMFSLDSSRSDTGFVATSFRQITALRQIDRDGRWHQLGAMQLRELQGCSLGAQREPVIPSDCGPRADLARRHALAMMASLRRRGATGDPESDLNGVGEAEVTPVTSVSLCRDLLRKLAQDVPGVDTIPLEGIMQTGGVGYIVSLSPLVKDPNSNGWITTAYLDPDLLIRVSQATKIGAGVR